VGIERSLLSYLAYSMAARFVALCGSGIVGTENIKNKTSVQNENHLFEDKNVVDTTLVNPEEVYLSPLYIKLGHIKTVTEVDQKRAGFIYSGISIYRFSREWRKQTMNVRKR
jgi:hypothetical protein